jgi:hypothetical protein
MQAQQAQMQAQQAQSDKEHRERMAELEKWFVRGAKMVVVNRREIQEADRRITALVIAQQGNEQRTQELHDSHLATEQSLREMQASLKAFIDSMSKGGNGH